MTRKPPAPRARAYEKRLAKRIAKALFTDARGKAFEKMELVEQFGGNPGWAIEAVEMEIERFVVRARRKRERNRL